jgi:hypothetical protein
MFAIKGGTVKRSIIAAVVLAGLVWSGRVPVAGQGPGPQLQLPLDPKVLAWDRGPDKIDISKYPPEIKQKYKTFVDLCSQCHSLARAINCDFVLDDDWERYIKRMMRRGKGLITPQIARESYDFAVYDSQVRKKQMYERRLKERQQQQP